MLAMMAESRHLPEEVAELNKNSTSQGVKVCQSTLVASMLTLRMTLPHLTAKRAHSSWNMWKRRQTRSYNISSLQRRKTSTGAKSKLRGQRSKTKSLTPKSWSMKSSKWESTSRCSCKCSNNSSNNSNKWVKNNNSLYNLTKLIIIKANQKRISRELISNFNLCKKRVLWRTWCNI